MLARFTKVKIVYYLKEFNSLKILLKLILKNHQRKNYKKIKQDKNQKIFKDNSIKKSNN
jgi:hypothetical protein